MVAQFESAFRIHLGVLSYSQWNISRECSSAATLLPDANFIRAVQTMYAANNSAYDSSCSLCTPKVSSILALKWWLVGLTAYDLIFYADLDIDFERFDLPPMLAGLRAFARARGAAIAADSDWAVPINTGAMVFRPNTKSYREGLSLLRTALFNTTHGIGLVGRPRSLLVRPQRFASNRMMVQDTWRVPGGSNDQGLFAIFYHLRGPVRYPNRQLVIVRHFWGAQIKPQHTCHRWVQQLQHRLSNESACNATVANWLSHAKNTCTKHTQSIM